MDTSAKELVPGHDVACDAPTELRNVRQDNKHKERNFRPTPWLGADEILRFAACGGRAQDGIVGPKR